MRKRMAIVLVPLGILLAGACAGSEGGSNGGADAETVSAEAYATGVCGAIAGWVDEIQGLNEDLQANLDPSSIDALKDTMVMFLDDVIASTDTVIADVEDVGIPDVDDGDAAAQHLLMVARLSRRVRERARPCRGHADGRPGGVRRGAPVRRDGHPDLDVHDRRGSRPVRVTGARRGVERHPGVRCGGRFGGVGGRSGCATDARILGAQLHMGVYWLRAGRVSPGRSGPRSPESRKTPEPTQAPTMSTRSLPSH